MANISITYDGPPVQRHVLKATALTPLSALLAEACSKMKPPLDPTRASLTFNKKPITDLSCPFRLSNIPNGSSLTLLYDKSAAGTTAGVATSKGPPAEAPAAAPPAPIAPSVTPASSSESPTAASVTAPASTPAAAAPPATPPPPPPPPPSAASQPPSGAGSDPAVAVARGSGAAATQVDGDSRGGATAAQAAGAPEAMEVDVRGHGAMDAGAAAVPPPAAEAPSSVPSSFSRGLADGAGVGGASDEVEDDEADLLGLGRPSALFSRQALEAALEATAGRSGGGAGSAAAGAGPGAGDDAGGGGGGAGGGGADDADDFYEVTPEDLVAMMRSSASRRVQAEASGFRTRAAREADELAKASSYSHVAIRAHLPGDSILQIVFAATETVGALRAAVLSVLSPSLAPAAYLYTTPPRTLLKPDQDAHTLYHVGLVPAAHVHVGLDEKKAAAAGHSAGSPVLRPEAAVRLQSRIGPGLAAFHGSKAAPGQGRESGQGNAGRQAQRPEASGDLVPAGEGRVAGGGAAGGGGGGKVPKWLKLGAK